MFWPGDIHLQSDQYVSRV